MDRLVNTLSAGDNEKLFTPHFVYTASMVLLGLSIVYLLASPIRKARKALKSSTKNNNGQDEKSKDSPQEPQNIAPSETE